MKFAYLIEPPFNHRNPGGNITGTDVELAKVVFHELELGTFEPIETEFAELLPGLAEGHWRMTTGLFANDDRKKLALFSKPIWALPDGLLVQTGNPKALAGYQSIALLDDCSLAVIRDQVQHQSAVEFGVNDDNLKVYETYTGAANAVLAEEVDAYASVGRAHTGYIELKKESGLEVVTVPVAEKQAAFGSFAFSLQDATLCDEVNSFLQTYLGSDDHRAMMHKFGFTNAEIDLIVR
ncbi:MAG: transporter substrate-binding domain-containing protein [Granulosicoccaceae bacterium]